MPLEAENNESECRKQIISEVAEYYRRFKQPSQYERGEYIPYASRVFDENEMMNLIDASLDFWLTAGKYTHRFEKQLGEYLGIKHALFVNSGSSANMLAFAALTQPELGKRRICRGDEVITVAAGFPTTIAPIIQYGAVPVFCDISLSDYNIDIAQMEGALSDKTKAVFLAHTLGNPFDLRYIRAFCDEHRLWLIEDNCDALGSEYEMPDGTIKKTGTIGDIGTSSFYPPHHMTTGEGGAVYTDDERLYKIMESLRDWGRDCSCPPGQDNCCGHRFDGQYGMLPQGYDHKYVYSHFGYNLKATDLQAAIGCAQLDKIGSLTCARRDNWTYLADKLAGYKCDKKLVLPKASPNSIPSWFGFLMCCRDGIDRDSVVRYLETHGVQTRMLFAGNIVKHPCFGAYRNVNGTYRIIGDLKNTDIVMERAFWIGVYPGMGEQQLDYMSECIFEALSIL